LSEFLKSFFVKRVESLTYWFKQRFQIPFWIFVTSEKFRIDQEPELVAAPVDRRFGKSETMVIKQTLSKGFPHSFLDSTLGEICVFA